MGLELLGAPVSDPVESIRPGPGHLHRDTEGPSPDPTPRHRTPLVVAIAALIVALGAGALTVLSSPPPMAPGSPPVPSGIAGTAELYLATYLSSGGAPGALAPFGVDDALVADMTPHQRYVTHVATIAITPVSDGRWIATVAADYLVLHTGGGYTGAPTGHFTVTVARMDDTLVIDGLPAPVGVIEPRKRPSVQGEATEGQREAVEGFVAAWLGHGDAIGRWATGAIDETMQPPRHADVTIEALWANGDTVTAVVGATDPTGHWMSYGFTLEVVEVDGTPMVTAVTPGTVRP